MSQISYSDAVDAIRRMQMQYEAISRVGELLEKLGSLESHRDSLTRQRDEAQKACEEACAAQDEAERARDKAEEDYSIRLAELEEAHAKRTGELQARASNLAKEAEENAKRIFEAERDSLNVHLKNLSEQVTTVSVQLDYLRKSTEADKQGADYAKRARQVAEEEYAKVRNQIASLLK